MEEINVLYTTDHNYLNYMLSSMYSLLENNKNNKINIHIVYDKFEKEDFTLIENVIKKFNNSNLFLHSFENIKNEIEKYNIPNWRDTKIANARLFFSKEIKDVDNLLYLDSDTFVVDDLSGLKKYKGAINMVQDNMSKNIIKELDTSITHYCNSGVLWVNMKKWLEDDCDKKLVDTIKSNKRIKFPDQDIINVALKDDICLLPPKYNLFSIDSYFSNFFLKKYYEQNHIHKDSMKNIFEAKKNPVILHGTPITLYTPQSISSNLHPYNNLYVKCLENIYGKEIKQDKDYLKKLIVGAGLHAKLLVPYEVKQKVKKLAKK